MNLKLFTALALLFSYAAVAAFFPQNGGMVLQQTIVTSSAGTATMVATSNQVQIVEGSTTHTLKLPSAIALPIGWHYELVNNSSGTVTVTDNAGTTILTLTGSRAGRVWVTARTTAAGTWKTTIYPAPGDIITDHGGLTGLSDDDHSQYHNDTRGDARYYRESEHISTSAGAADASKPIILNGSGQIDSTMLPAAGSSWSLTGNSGLTAGTNFVGNTDAVDLVFKSNNSEVMRLTSAGVIDTGLTGSRVIITNGSGGLTVATMDSAYLTATSPLQEQIDGKEPSFTLLPLSDGGTNKNMTAVNGGLLYTDADSAEVGAAGTSGQAAISGGAGAPTWYAPTLGSVLFAGTSGALSQDNSVFFWDATNNRLGIGNAAPAYALDISAAASTETVLSLDPTSGSDVDFRFESTLFRIDIGSATMVSFGSGNMNLNGTATPLWSVQHSSAATQTTLANYLLRDQGYPVLAVKNTSSTANNASGIAFAGNGGGSGEATSGILGVHEVHTNGSETGHLEFWARNAGTNAKRLNIGSDGVLTASAYGVGIATSNSAGVISMVATVNSAAIGLGRNQNVQTGSTYTFKRQDGLSHGGMTVVVGSSGSAQTFTVPANSNVQFPNGEQIEVCQDGAGKVTMAGASGVTINSKSSNKAIGAQYVCVSLIKVSTDIWRLIGDLIP